MIELVRRLPRVGTRRGIRAALAGSGTFSFFYEVVHNPIAAVFAAFGSMVLLVYVEFGGPKRQRFEQHFGLIVMTSVFVVLGTLCSQVLWLAVSSTIVFCFCRLDVRRHQFFSGQCDVGNADQFPSAGRLSGTAVFYPRSSPWVGRRQCCVARRPRVRHARAVNGSPHRGHGQRPRQTLDLCSSRGIDHRRRSSAR